MAWSIELAREYVDILIEDMEDATNDLSTDIKRLRLINDDELRDPALMRAYVRGACGYDLALDETMTFFYAICLGDAQVFWDLVNKRRALMRNLGKDQAEWRPHQKAWLDAQNAFWARIDIETLPWLSSA